MLEFTEQIEALQEACFTLPQMRQETELLRSYC